MPSLSPLYNGGHGAAGGSNSVPQPRRWLQSAVAPTCSRAAGEGRRRPAARMAGAAAPPRRAGRRSFCLAAFSSAAPGRTTARPRGPRPMGILVGVPERVARAFLDHGPRASWTRPCARAILDGVSDIVAVGGAARGLPSPPASCPAPSGRADDRDSLLGRGRLQRRYQRPELRPAGSSSHKSPTAPSWPRTAWRVAPRPTVQTTGPKTRASRPPHDVRRERRRGVADGGAVQELVREAAPDGSHLLLSPRSMVSAPSSAASSATAALRGGRAVRRQRERREERRHRRHCWRLCSATEFSTSRGLRLHRLPVDGRPPGVELRRRRGGGARGGRLRRPRPVLARRGAASAPAAAARVRALAAVPGAGEFLLVRAAGAGWLSVGPHLTAGRAVPGSPVHSSLR